MLEEIEGFLNQIDFYFEKHKDAGLGRYSLEWGLWSHDFNKNLRNRIYEIDAMEAIPFQYTFLYWINRSELLQLYFIKKRGTLLQKISSFPQKPKEKQLIEEGKEYKRLAMLEKYETSEVIDQNFVIRRLMKVVVENEKKTE